MTSGTTGDTTGSEISTHEPGGHYDVVVLGGGSGNTVIDERFDDQRVAIVERGPLGGTCLNRGCIPSKMYVHPADLAVGADRGPALGWRTSNDGARWEELRARVVGRIDDVAEAGRRGRAEAPNIDLLTGTARFVGERRLVVRLDDGTDVELDADQVVIATGTRPVVPDLPGLHDVVHHTSDTIMRMERLPRRLAILGGGYIGCEFAHVFSAAGVEVTQLESASTLLGKEDAEIAERFVAAAGATWGVRLDCEVTSVTPVGDAARLHLSDGTEVEVDMVLVATGRVPNTDELGLDAAGVETNDDGLVTVDEHQHTSAEGVWALGDASDGVPLKHVANHEARVVQHNLLHPDDLATSTHDAVPHAVFSHPQVAGVGLTEAEARDRGIDLAIGRADYKQTAYGWAMQSSPDDESPGAAGFVKVLADRRTRRIVGAHLIGADASILIQPLVQAAALGLDAGTLARDQYWIHPAHTEVVEAALLDLAEQLTKAVDPIQ